MDLIGEDNSIEDGVWLRCKSDFKASKWSTVGGRIFISSSFMIYSAECLLERCYLGDILYLISLRLSPY